jgi:hypothetical protein
MSELYGEFINEVKVLVEEGQGFCDNITTALKLESTVAKKFMR